MSTIQATGSLAVFLCVPVSNGKDVKNEEGFNTVRIPEKKEGKGKGKTVAYCNIAALSLSAEVGSFSGILSEVLEELQREIVISLYRAGKTQIVEDEISTDACLRYWSEKSFSSESVGTWFDGDMRPLLEFMIATAKGWIPAGTEEFTPSEEQGKYIDGKCAAYRASYIECASKFPKLNPDQMSELRRVLDLGELSGPIVDRIREKITPVVVSSALGF